MERFYSEQQRKSPEGGQSSVNNVTRELIQKADGEGRSGMQVWLALATKCCGGCKPLSLWRLQLR